jgi:hypothetical protein
MSSIMAIVHRFLIDRRPQKPSKNAINKGPHAEILWLGCPNGCPYLFGEVWDFAMEVVGVKGKCVCQRPIYVIQSERNEAGDA